MPEVKPMTREEVDAARLRVESFRPDGSTTVIERGDVYYLKKALATIEDRDARLVRIWDICQYRSDDVSKAVCNEIADLLKRESHA